MIIHIAVTFSHKANKSKTYLHQAFTKRKWEKIQKVKYNRYEFTNIIWGILQRRKTRYELALCIDCCVMWTKSKWSFMVFPLFFIFFPLLLNCLSHIVWKLMKKIVLWELPWENGAFQKFKILPQPLLKNMEKSRSGKMLEMYWLLQLLQLHDWKHCTVNMPKLFTFTVMALKFFL